jgi:hypothetical protein
MERRSFLCHAAGLLGMTLMPFPAPRRVSLLARGQKWHWIRPAVWKAPGGSASQEGYRHTLILERVQVLDWAGVLDLVGTANSGPFLNVVAGGLIFDSITLSPIWSGRAGGRWWRAEVNLLEPLGGCRPGLPRADMGRLA